MPSPLSPLRCPLLALLLCALGLSFFAPVPRLLAEQTPPGLNFFPQPEPKPVVQSDSVSAVVGQLFTYQVRATNLPISYSATNLPEGLVIDQQTGIISGTPTLAGLLPVTVQASNFIGTGTADLQLAVFLKPVPVVNIVFEKDAAITDGKITVGSFLLTRTGGDIADTVKVGFTAEGGSLGGVDYIALKTAANIRGTKGLKHLKITPIDQGASSKSKKVKVTLHPGIGYLLGDQTIAKIKLILSN